MMKSFFRHALQALILLMVALVSALVAMRSAIHGREVAVPDLVGKTPAEARHVAENDGFRLRSNVSTTARKCRKKARSVAEPLQQGHGSGVAGRRVGSEYRAAAGGIPNVLGESQRAAELNIPVAADWMWRR